MRDEILIPTQDFAEKLVSLVNNPKPTTKPTQRPQDNYFFRWVAVGSQITGSTSATGSIATPYSYYCVSTKLGTTTTLSAGTTPVWSNGTETTMRLMTFSGRPITYDRVIAQAHGYDTSGNMWYFTQLAGGESTTLTLCDHHTDFNASTCVWTKSTTTLVIDNGGIRRIT